MDDTLNQVTYEKLFPEQVADKCAPDALESNTGPLAYLHALYRQALDLEEKGNAETRIPLNARRPDIGELLMDQASLENKVPALTLAIRALSRQAQAHAGDQASLPRVIAEARYPARLPWHYPLEQIKAVLKHRKIALFDLLQQSSDSFPNFVYDNLRTDGLRGSMLTACGLAPHLQTLLLDNTPATGDDYLKTRYGVEGSLQEAIDYLSNVDNLCKSTGLSSEEVLDLLAISSVADDGTDGIPAVRRSAFYRPAQDILPDGHHYGAAFIHNGVNPTLNLKDTLNGPGISLTLSGATAEHFGRMYKIIHLQQALKLPFADVDLLLMSAMRAEGQSKNFQITATTLRALGVFDYLRTTVKISAEQFAALIYEVTPYAVNEAAPFLDRVLDGPGSGQLADIDNPLMINGKAVDLSAGSGSSSLGQLCQAFAVDEQTLSLQVSRACTALSLKKPTLSLALISSLYRQNRLPRLLGRNKQEGEHLLALFAQAHPEMEKLLAGKPLLSDKDDQPNTLDVLIGLINLDSWLRKQKTLPQVLSAWLTPLPELSAKENALLRVDAQVKRVLIDAYPTLQASLLSEEQIILAAGPDAMPVAGNWRSLLSAFMDERGLLKALDLPPGQTCKDLLTAALKNKVKATDSGRKTVDLDGLAARLEAVLDRSSTAQDDVLKHMVGTAFGRDDNGAELTPEHILPLLRWADHSRFTVLEDVLSAAATALKQGSEKLLEDLDVELWHTLTRHACVVKWVGLSAEGLNALLDHPQWFDLVDAQAAAEGAMPALNINLCYQTGLYVNWVQTCLNNDFTESDALGYFSTYPIQDKPTAATAAAAAKRLAELTGGSESDIDLRLPTLTLQRTQGGGKTLDDFLATVSAEDLSYYNYCEKFFFKGLGAILNRIYNGSYPNAKSITDQFLKFIEANPPPLRVRKNQYLPAINPAYWNELEGNKKNPVITLVVDETITVTETLKYTPQTISDIDAILRAQKSCAATRLSCQALLDLCDLDEQSTYDDFNKTAQLLMAACDEPALQAIEPALQEAWRDTLIAYLMGHWLPATPTAQRLVTTVDDLSAYFLTDVWVGPEVNTTAVTQATANLQHYLHRLYARLEPGAEYLTIPEEHSNAWRQYLSIYGLWKRWQAQVNHPENLIHYRNRPNKSKAFELLEVELNQGKLDPELLQTSITSYLTKFEQTSNLQVVSGYLDGNNPKEDTYYFIGKSNTAPAEYFWRSLDISLRDGQERLSPLAWGEWEKIGISISGQIAQSSYIDPATKEKITCDAIRPVLIEGRPYVFWVERGVTGLPSADEKNQTPTKFKKLSVYYIFRQSDGYWSPANEMLCLDGTKDGKRLPDAGNPYLKDDTYEPGLIALVNHERERANNPWLTVVLYNCAYKAQGSAEEQKKLESTKYGNLDQDYFVESRDLLLIKKNQLADKEKITLIRVSHNSYSDIRKVQHPYTGEIISELKSSATQHHATSYLLEPYDRESFSTPGPEKLDLNTWYMGNNYNYRDPKNTEDRIREHHPLIQQSPGIEIKSNITRNEKTTAIENALSQRARQSFGKGAFFYLRNIDIGPSHSIQATLDTKKSRINITANYRTTIAGNKFSFTPYLFTNDTLHPTKEITINVTLSKNQKTYTIELIFTEITESSEILIREQGVFDFLLETEVLPKPQTPPKVSFSLEEGLLTRGCVLELYINSSRKIHLYSKSLLDTANCKEINLRLYAKGPQDKRFTRLTQQAVVANGQATLTYDYPYTESGRYMFALCEAGNPLQNAFATYDILGPELDEEWDISIRRNEQQAQYLDLSALSQTTPTFPSNTLRLNTLFGKQLVSRAARSVDRALEWEAQLIQEPTIDPNNPTPPVDFHGGNGGYFRELFLHLPALIATRLSEQQQFDDAEDWYTRYLLNPYRTDSAADSRPPLWNTRPLAEVGTGRSEIYKQVDPTARAFILSRYYRQAVFLGLLDNWQRQGDQFYRQLTPSSLNHAWLCYQKALKLLGPLPQRVAVSRWIPMALSEIDGSGFRTPMNERVIELRKTLERRLYNLRHGLTLDGKLLPAMDWRSEGDDAFGFMQRGIGRQLGNFNSDLAQIPAYRFRQLVPMARAALQQLQDMGRHYMKLMEDEFNTTLSVQLKLQEIRISDFTLKLKQEAVNAVVSKKRTLAQSRRAAVARQGYYAGLLEVGRSPTEESATGLLWTSSVLKSMAIPFHTAAGIADSLIPKIFGMAFGGNDPSAPMARTALGLEVSAESGKFIAEQLLMESGYERRAQEWQFELQQAELDIESIDLQLKETDIEHNAATLSLEESRMERTNLEEAHLSMTTGFTIIPIYNWLVARQELLYAPAYDGVLALCLSAEAAWRYEIGDYDRPAFIKTDAWRDAYKGMLAGEALLVDLQEMENAWLQCNERRLNIRKSKDLKGEQTDAQWLATLKGLGSKPMEFEFKSIDFDRNYPGHYLRQIKHVSVSFVMTSGNDAPLENVSAILTQTDSSTLVKPLAEGAQYLYQPGSKTPDCIKRNLRANKQIALSSAQNDDGLAMGETDWVYELMFHDGRYLPFEGTGAVSRWQLSFPDADFVKALVSADGKTAQVKSIRVDLVYTAVDGGSEFTGAIKELMTKA